MKIRNGFVSNSSTTSFTIYGSQIADDVIKEELFKRIDEGKLDAKYKNDILVALKGYGLSSILEKIFDENEINLSIDIGEYDDIYVGRHWDSIKEGETGGEFRQKTLESIRNVFGEKQSCNEHSESWYDG